MVGIRKLNKEEIGKLLTPNKIFSFNYKNKLISAYQKGYRDNFNYFYITYIFFLSIMVAFLLQVLFYEKIYIFLYDYIIAGFHYQFIINLIINLVLSLFIYLFLLFFLFFRIEANFKRKEQDIERDLPDFIDSLVSNLKGGISLEKALMKSVRPEQKSLLEEITFINESVMIGKNVYEAISDFRRRFESPIIIRTFFLIEEGISGGGNIAEPLEKISQNLKNIYNLNDELKANVGGFSMIIKVISLIIAPLLFALAITLLNFIGELFKMMSTTDSTYFSVSEIPSEFYSYLIIFSYAMIFLITLFSSLISSQLKGDKIYEALKYLPFYIAISLLLYWQFSKMLMGIFAGFF